MAGGIPAMPAVETLQPVVVTRMQQPHRWRRYSSASGATAEGNGGPGPTYHSPNGA
jgi:hypothetical protein